MTDDFYLDASAAAAYFEKDWFDHVVRAGGARPGRFAFAPFNLGELYTPHHERIVDLVAENSFKPTSVFEVGSSTGRFFYELCLRYPSLTRATLVEPSARLREIFGKLFMGPTTDPYFSVPKGNGELADVRLNVADVRAVTRNVTVDLVGTSFAEVTESIGQFDLVVAANVLDQCHRPLDLVALLKRATAPGGRLVLTCTYQWQAKYRSLPTKPIRHLDELFGDQWRLVGEANVPFQLRVNERHWMTFLSHACVFEKTSD